MRPSASQKSGYVLLLSTLILSAVVAIAVGIYELTLSGVTSNRSLSNVIVSYFGAESMVEQTLHLVKSNRLTGQTLGGTLSTAASWCSPITPCQLPNSRAAVPQVSATSPKTATFNAQQDQTYFFDLFNPDDLSQPANVESLRIDAASRGASVQTRWLEISWVEITPGLGFSLDPATAVKNFIAANLSDAVNTALVVPNIPTGGTVGNITELTRVKVYRVAVKSLYGDSSVTLTPCSTETPCTAEDPAVNVRGQVLIKAVGSYPSSGTQVAQQAVTATVNWLTPSSPLFDYTLFSEQTLEKH